MKQYRCLITSILLCEAGLVFGCQDRQHEQQKQTDQQDQNNQKTDSNTYPHHSGKYTDTDTDDTIYDDNCVPDPAPEIDPNPVCKTPAPFKAPDGYPCWKNDNCASNVCDQYICGSFDAMKEVHDVPLGGACFSKECANGSCIFMGMEAYCTQTCKKGDSGDGTYYCGENLYGKSDKKYYCQIDPKIGRKCCKNSDCGAGATCFNQICVTECPEGDGYAHCPNGSTCTNFTTNRGFFDFCIVDGVLGTIPPGGKCGNDAFCASGHCVDNICQDLSKVNCSGPHDYPDFKQADGYPCNADRDCASGHCDLKDNAFICTDWDLYHEIHGLPDNAPCQLDEECASGYCWYNGGAQFKTNGWSDASYCAQPCDPKFATSDGNFSCQKNNFNKYICQPVRSSSGRGAKGSSCYITEFDCNENMTCDRADKVCKGI